MHSQFSKSRLWLTIMLPYALGYFVATAFRTINAVLAFPIMRELHLNNMQIGWVTSLYVLTFALAQIPLGMLLDHWGPRKTQALFFIIGGIGAIVFGMAPNVAILSLGRALLGLGMAGGLMSAFKAISEWFEKERVPFLNALILTAGGLGALSSTTPSKLFQIHYGWRSLFVILGILTFLIALLIFLVSRDKSHEAKDDWNLWHQILALKTIYTDSFFWQIVPLLIVSLGGFIGMQGLWLGPWLRTVVGFGPVASANCLLIMAIAMILGFLSGGLFSLLAKYLKIPLHIFIMGGIVIHILTQIVIVLNIISSSYAIWFVYSYFSQVTLVNYAIITQYFGSKLSGRATTAANILTFLTAFLVQVAFGMVVHYWPRGGGDSIIAYQVAFLGLIVLEILALFWFIIAELRRKSARSKST